MNLNTSIQILVDRKKELVERLVSQQAYLKEYKNKLDLATFQFTDQQERITSTEREMKEIDDGLQILNANQLIVTGGAK